MNKIIGSILFFMAATANAQVIDSAGIIDDQTEMSLNEKLDNYKRISGKALIVITLDDINQNHFVADDDVLFLISPSEHAISIQTGIKIRKHLSNFEASIIKSAIEPYFISNDFQVGIVDGTDRIISYISPSNYKQKRKIAKPDGVISPTMIFIIIVLLLLIYHVILIIIKSKSSTDT